MQKTAKLWWGTPPAARPRRACQTAARTATGTGPPWSCRWPVRRSGPAAGCRPNTPRPPGDPAGHPVRCHAQSTPGRPGTSKLLGHRPQPSVVAGQSELQEACRVGRPAVAVVIGREAYRANSTGPVTSGAGGCGSRGVITRSPHQFESLQGLLSTGGDRCAPPAMWISTQSPGPGLARPGPASRC